MLQRVLLTVLKSAMFSFGMLMLCWVSFALVSVLNNLLNCVHTVTEFTILYKLRICIRTYSMYILAQVQETLTSSILHMVQIAPIRDRIQDHSDFSCRMLASKERAIFSAIVLSEQEDLCEGSSCQACKICLKVSHIPVLSTPKAQHFWESFHKMDIKNKLAPQFHEIEQNTKKKLVYSGSITKFYVGFESHAQNLRHISIPVGTNSCKGNQLKVKSQRGSILASNPAIRTRSLCNTFERQCHQMFNL